LRIGLVTGNKKSGVKKKDHQENKRFIH